MTGEDLKKIFKNIMLSLFAIAAITGFACMFTPDYMGYKQVIKTLIQYACILVMGAGFLFLGVAMFGKMKDRAYVPVLLILFGIGGVLMGMTTCFNGIRGLQAGPVEADGGNYYVTSSNSFRGRNKYYLHAEHLNSVKKLAIDKRTYNYIENSGSDVVITYYPYVNIADEVICK